MKQIAFVILVSLLIASCHTGELSSQASSYNGDTTITQSLFNDKAATISEDNIQKILDGNYTLPERLRVAIVRIENNQQKKSYYWNDEDYLKTQQSYIDMFSEKLKQSPGITKISVIPDLLISRFPSFTNIREAAVRMQADIVMIYSITSDLYSKYKFFSRPDIKAFATTQLIVLDVRTGLVPFSAIITKDVLSQKKKEEMDNAEAKNRIQNEAVLLTINEMGQKLTSFLRK
jgi:hypothetical protein